MYLFIGDNPIIDVKSVLSLGKPWNGLLVKSGLYKGEDLEFTPTYVGENALDAVKWAINQNKK